MHNGGDVKGVFTRFCQRSNAMKEQMKELVEKTGKKLIWHPTTASSALACRTSAPACVAVMIVLPKLNKDPRKLQEICAVTDLQPRGSSGEHSAAVGDKWDLSRGSFSFSFG